VTVLQFPANAKTVPDCHLTTAELCDQAGISYRMADHWCRTGYLHSVEPQPGSGYVRSFPISELAAARLVVAGMKPRQAFTLARDLLEHGHTQLGGIRIDLPQDL
jgi:hypothetical protein